MKAPSGKNRDLILVRAGSRSLHRGWMAAEPADQPFDLIAIAYAPTFIAPDRDDFGYVEIPGFKVAGYGAFLRQYRQIVERYDQVALIDDDIETDSRAIAKAFELGRAHDLQVWQPSLSWDSHFSYAALLSCPGQPAIRPVNFVEMMCPFFKTPALLEVEDLLHIGAETAVDIFWSCVLGRHPGGLAILNDVIVTHTRPVGDLRAMNGFDETVKGYGDEISRLMAAHDVPSFPGAIPLTSSAGERRSPTARLGSAWAMLGLLGGVSRTPMKLRRFLRILASDMLRVAFGNARIPGDPDRILAQARQMRIAREYLNQDPASGAA